MYAKLLATLLFLASASAAAAPPEEGSRCPLELDWAMNAAWELHPEELADLLKKEGIHLESTKHGKMIHEIWRGQLSPWILVLRTDLEKISDISFETTEATPLTACAKQIPEDAHRESSERLIWKNETRAFSLHKRRSSRSNLVILQENWSTEQSPTESPSGPFRGVLGPENLPLGSSLEAVKAHLEREGVQAKERTLKALPPAPNAPLVEEKVSVTLTFKDQDIEATLHFDEEGLRQVIYELSLSIEDVEARLLELQERYGAPAYTSEWESLTWSQAEPSLTLGIRRSKSSEGESQTLLTLHP